MEIALAIVASQSSRHANPSNGIKQPKTQVKNRTWGTLDPHSCYSLELQKWYCVTVYQHGERAKFCVRAARPSNDKLLFTSYERDSESGNDYGQARYIISRLGRFSSPDPIAGSVADPQSLNRYSYVRNMPVMLTDPFGTCPGGVAQNRDTNQPQDTNTGGPYSTDADAGDPQGIGSSIPPGPCRGFTDQGGGAGGGGGISIDGGEVGGNSGLGPGGMGFPVGGGDIFGLMQIPIFGYSWQTETSGPLDDQTTVSEWTYGQIGTGLFFASGGVGDPGGGYDPRADFRDYAVQLSNNHNMSDCEKLVRMIFKAGQAFGPIQGVLGLLNGLTEVGGPLGPLSGHSDPQYRVGVFRSDLYYADSFSDDGFLPLYQDPDPNSNNQVRHFVGWFAAGHYLGNNGFTRGRLYNAEETDDPENPDVALGLAALQMGQSFGFAYPLDYGQLAQNVWHSICGGTTDLKLK